MNRKAVLVLSGKGGTGKTLISVNIGAELVKRGSRVAIIDADIDNPNLLPLLGLRRELEVSKERLISPISLRPPYPEMQVFSMAGIALDHPISMEGSEYVEILTDVVNYSNWEADYFVVDLPSGISDTFKGVVRIFDQQLLGSVVVMQPAHAASARGVITLHALEGIPVIGVIENMTSFHCSKCGDDYEVFGESQLTNVTELMGVTPLGRIPLSMEIRKGVSEGKPWLTAESMKPVERAVDIILEAKPVKLSFAERVAERGKAIAREALFDVIATVITSLNTEINIGAVQKEHGFPGGNVIELDITDEDVKTVTAQLFFRVEEGSLKVVKAPKEIMAEIRVWDKALIWGLLGQRPDTGAPYSLRTAWLTGRAKYYSYGQFRGTPTALYFFNNLWGELQGAEGIKKIEPLLRRLA